MSKITKLINNPKAFVGDALKKRSPELYEVSEVVYKRASLVFDTYLKTVNLPGLAKMSGLAQNEVNGPVINTSSTLPRTFLIGFSPWKQFMVSWFPDRDMHFIPINILPKDFKAKWENVIRKSPNAEIMVWGMKSPKFIQRFAIENKIPLKFVEDGFIRSIALGATKTPPFSLNIDSRTPYFNAQQPSDLEVLLSSYDFDADPELLERAEKLIEMLVTTGISKYNQSTKVNIDDIYGKKTKKRILVVGQVEDDASILFGCDRRFTNNDAVMIAYVENPDAHIIYKPHPEILHKTRQMQSDPDEVRHICQVLDIDIPLAQSFETIDHVYTITSQAGFEALMRGIPVTTLGCPFYAGWGVTDDRQPNDRRTRQLTVKEIFAGTYLLYSKYFDPIYKTAITAEQAVERLNYLKGLASNAPSADTLVVKKTVVPNGAKPKLYLFKFTPWKGSFMHDLFLNNSLEFIPIKIVGSSFREEWSSKIIAEPGDGILVWGMQAPLYLLKFAEDNKIPLRYAEDGFIRSIGLGITHTPPLSMTIDSRTPYFNATVASDLEVILSTYNFQEDPDLLERARLVMKQLVDSGLSKYNQSDFVNDITSIYGVKTKRRILVIGQVEDDASILFGSERRYSNNDLVTIAYVENPDAHIIYKPHPDVLNKTRAMQSNPDDVRHICQVIDVDLPLSQAFETIDHVYTITSQAGFEALMRGIKVTTLGCPFYSGWGLTDDRQVNNRRTRQLTVEEVFAGAYILYTRYYDPIYKRPTEIEQALSRLASMRAMPKTVVQEEVSLEQIKIWVLGLGDNSDQRHVHALLTDYDKAYIPHGVSDDGFKLIWQPRLTSQKRYRSKVFAWVPSLSKYIESFLEANGFEIHYLDIAPFSRLLTNGRYVGIAMDKQGSYRDSSKACELENLLNSYEFESEDVLNKAQLVLDKYLTQKKSNIDSSKAMLTLKSRSDNKRKKVVVIGESSQDLDVLLAKNRGFNVNDILGMAMLENPEAEICLYTTEIEYQHILAGEGYHAYADISLIDSRSINWDEAIASADQVYTIASILGFDALLKGITVKVLGSPFYAGWGLTVDSMPISRRLRQLTLLQFFAVVSIVYPVYIDTIYKTKVDISEVL